MATIVDGGHHVFRALAYTTPVDETMNRIRNSGNRHDSSLTSRALERFGAIREKHIGFDFRSAQNKAKAAMRKLNSYWTSDCIRKLDKIGELQHPPEKMIRYLMAEPETRERFYNNRCEGYGDRYNDPYPNRVGNDDPVYRQVMEGIWVEDDEGQFTTTEWWATEESDEEQHIEFSEQLDILHSWDALKKFLTVGKDDPTSPWNGQL